MWMLNELVGGSITMLETVFGRGELVNGVGGWVLAIPDGADKGSGLALGGSDRQVGRPRPRPRPP